MPWLSTQMRTTLPDKITDLASVRETRRGVLLIRLASKILLANPVIELLLLSLFQDAEECPFAKRGAKNIGD